MKALFPTILLLLAVELSSAQIQPEESLIMNPILIGDFRWMASAPLVSPAFRPDDPCVSIKDPSVVFFEGKWHLFCTIRSKVRTHQIEYLSFSDWNKANIASRSILSVTDGYFCAPQVFYFTPIKKWFLIYQTADQSRQPVLQPAFSTSVTLSDPSSWSKPEFLFESDPVNMKGWIDFWVICDDHSAYLFFTSLDGRMWRSETPLAKFPHGWSQPVVALQADIFEASHIYRLLGMNKYLALIEAQHDGRRYYKAYLADQLNGVWKPCADTYEKAFASPFNCKDTSAHWTDSFSHGELLRAGNDEKLEVNPQHLRFLFQGVSDQAKAGKNYGEIPWRLGILEAVGEK